MERLKDRPFIVVFTRRFKQRPYKRKSESIFDAKTNIDEETPEADDYVLDASGNPVIDRDAEPKWHMEERVEFHDSIKKRWETEATVIIDIFKRKVVKNGFPQDDEHIFDHYMQEYSDKIVQAMEVHAKNVASKKGLTTAEAIKEIEAEMEFRDEEPEEKNPS